MTKVTLSAKDMYEASRFDRNNFEFKVGDTSFVCGLVQACLISSKVRKFLTADAAVSELIVETGNADQFRSIETLMNGGSVPVTNVNIEYLKRISAELENSELMERVLACERAGSRRPTSIDNALSGLRERSAFGVSCDMEIEFLAENFAQIDHDHANDLSIDELDVILQHEKLNLESEDSLLAIVLSKKDEVSGCYPLLSHVWPECLLPESLEDYVEAARNSCNGALLESALSCVRRLSMEHPKGQRSSRTENNEFMFVEDRPLDGILAHLAKKVGGSEHLSKTVIVTGSGDNQLFKPAHGVLTGKSWTSKNEPKSSITFHFKEVKICLNAYTLKVGPGNGHLRQWELYGADNGSNWKRLDAQKTTSLDAKNAIQTFKVDGSYVPFSHFKLVQTGLDSSKNNFLELAGVEFFGKISGM